MSFFKNSITIGGVSFDLVLITVVVVTTLLPMLDWYGYSPLRWSLNQIGLTGLSHVKAYDRLVFYFVIPLLIIVLLWRERPAAYGLQWGNWREGLLWCLVACLGMTVVLWFVARSPAMTSYYSARTVTNPLLQIYLTAVDLWAWEFVWRGFMLFALARLLGAGPAIWIQAIPFAFMHLGKPEIETISTIFGGAIFGFIAWRTESMIYPFLIHWYIASFTYLIALGRF